MPADCAVYLCQFYPKFPNPQKPLALHRRFRYTNPGYISPPSENRASVAPGTWLGGEYAVYHMRVTVAPPPGGLPASTAAASGGGGAADPDDLGAFLQRLGLPQFQKPFENSGLDSVSKLAGLDSGSLKALGLRQV